MAIFTKSSSPSIGITEAIASGYGKAFIVYMAGTDDEDRVPVNLGVLNYPFQLATNYSIELDGNAWLATSDQTIVSDSEVLFEGSHDGGDLIISGEGTVQIDGYKLGINEISNKEGLHTQALTDNIVVEKGSVVFIGSDVVVNDVAPDGIFEEGDMVIAETGTVAITGENLGTGDATETDFTLQHANVGTLVVYLDGAAQTLTTDYTVAGQVITFVTPPGVGVAVTADYARAGGNIDIVGGKGTAILSGDDSPTKIYLNQIAYPFTLAAGSGHSIEVSKGSAIWG